MKTAEDRKKAGLVKPETLDEACKVLEETRARLHLSMDSNEPYMYFCGFRASKANARLN